MNDKQVPEVLDGEQKPVAATSGEGESSPWGQLGWGLFMIAAGVVLYFMFDNWEQEGGSRRMNALVLLLYKLMGKTGVAVVFSGIGLLMSVAGVLGLTRKKV